MSVNYKLRDRRIRKIPRIETCSPIVPLAAHQTLKNRILLENYFVPGDLEAQIGAFSVGKATWNQSLRDLGILFVNTA